MLVRTKENAHNLLYMHFSNYYVYNLIYYLWVAISAGILLPKKSLLREELHSSYFYWVTEAEESAEFKDKTHLGTWWHFTDDRCVHNEVKGL